MSRTLALLTLAAALGGCASAGKSPVESMPPPSSPQDAREQMFRLEAMIRDNRLALGLPQGEDGRVAQGGGAADMEQAPGAQPGPGHRTAEPAAASPPPEPMMPAAAPQSDESAGAGPVLARSESREAPICAPGCRHTRAICQAAERICSLARYLGEKDAFRRCERARRDCSDARRATADRDCDDCD